MHLYKAYNDSQTRKQFIFLTGLIFEIHLLGYWVGVVSFLVLGVVVVALLIMLCFHFLSSSL